MDITCEKLFDCKTNIKKFNNKYYIIGQQNKENEKYKFIYDKLTKFLDKYNIKLYVGLTNNIQSRMTSYDFEPLMDNNIYFTDTKIKIHIQPINDKSFVATFFINDDEVQINFNEHDEEIKLEDEVETFFMKTEKYIHPQIIFDYLLLCEDEQQQYAMAILNNQQNEKEKALNEEIAKLNQYIIKLEYDNLVSIDEENTKILDLQDMLRQKNNLINKLSNKIKKLKEPYTISAYTLSFVIATHLFLCGVYFVNMFDSNNWS